MNSQIFAHELTHILTFPQMNVGSPELQSTFGSTLLGESIPDIGAAALGFYGEVDKTLPACMIVRNYSSVRTYNDAFGYFDIYFSARKDIACCEKAKTSGEPNFQQICSDTLAPLSGKTADEAFGTFNKSKLEPENWTQQFSSLAPHHLGTPIVSFLYQLSRTTQINAFTIFLRAIRNLTPVLAKCGIPTSKSEEDFATASGFELKEVFKKLKAEIPQKHHSAYEKLWRQHALDSSLTLDSFDLKDRLRHSGERELAKAMSKNQSSVLNFKNECLGVLENQYGDFTPKCKVTCK